MNAVFDQRKLRQEMASLFLGLFNDQLHSLHGDE
jgi:hypothetical protein